MQSISIFVDRLKTNHIKLVKIIYTFVIMIIVVRNNTFFNTKVTKIKKDHFFKEITKILPNFLTQLIFFHHIKTPHLKTKYIPFLFICYYGFCFSKLMLSLYENIFVNLANLIQKVIRWFLFKNQIDISSRVFLVSTYSNQIWITNRLQLIYSILKNKKFHFCYVIKRNLRWFLKFFC